jgi:hypothetical protein
LLQLSKVVEALRRRRFESAPSVESSHAVEPGVSRSSQSAESCRRAALEEVSAYAIDKQNGRITAPKRNDADEMFSIVFC